jgi:hypothetical protein
VATSHPGARLSLKAHSAGVPTRTEVATQADPFIKKRLLRLASNFDAMTTQPRMTVLSNLPETCANSFAENDRGQRSEVHHHLVMLQSVPALYRAQVPYHTVATAGLKYGKRNLRFGSILLQKSKIEQPEKSRES